MTDHYNPPQTQNAGQRGQLIEKPSRESSPRQVYTSMKPSGRQDKGILSPDMASIRREQDRVTLIMKNLQSGQRRLEQSNNQSQNILPTYNS